MARKTLLQAMKDWHNLSPELFKTQAYRLPGCDTCKVPQDCPGQSKWPGRGPDVRGSLCPGDQGAHHLDLFAGEVGQWGPHMAGGKAAQRHPRLDR